MKNLKKVLSVLLVVVMLATAMVPAFAAETATISADAKVCADIGMLLGDGNGVTPEYTKTTLTRVQAAVLLLRLKGLDAEAAKFTGTANFADVKADDWFAPYTAYLKAHPELGFIGDGVNFNANDKISAQQYYKVVLTALGFEEGAGKDYAYDKTVEFAATKGLTKLTAAKVELTVDDLAVATVEGLKATVKAGTKTLAATLVDAGKLDSAKAIAAGLVPAPVTGTTVTVTGAKKFTVAFDSAIDDTKATVTVKKGSVGVNVASVAASADKKSLVVTMASKITEGEYVVSVAGLSEKAIEAKVTAADEKVAKIEFVGDKASYSRGVTTSVEAALKVYNQYNEDVTSTYAVLAPGAGVTESLSVTASGATGVTQPTDKGLFTITGTYALENKISVTALYSSTNNSAFATAVLTVSNQAQVADIQLTSLYNADDKVLSAANFDDYNFYIIVDAKDQYGKAITANATGATNFFTDVLVSSTNTSVVVAPTSAEIVKVSGTDKIAMKIEYPKKADGSSNAIGGTATINVISKINGKLVSFPITVKEAVKVDTFTMTAPTVAPAGKSSIKIPFTAVDQFGNEVTDFDTLNTTVSVSSTLDTVGAKAIKFQNNYVTNKAELVLDTTSMTAKGTVAVTATTSYTTSSPTKVSTLSINVTDLAVPTVISGYTSDVKVNLLDKGGNQEIKNTFITLLDQNGSAYNMNTWNGTDSKGYTYYFQVSTSDAAIVDFANKDVKQLATTTSLGRLTAKKKGTATITVKLFKSNDAGASYTEVANSAYATTFTVVEFADITSFAVNTVATMYENPNQYTTNSHANDVSVTGTLANGKTVTIPAKQADGVTKNYSTVTTSTYFGNSEGTNTASGKVYSTGTGYAWESGVTEREVGFVVTVYGKETKVLLNTTKISKVAVTPNATSLRTNSDSAMHVGGTLTNSTMRIASYNYEDASTVSISAAAATNRADVRKLVNTAVKVVDQYGKTMPTAVYTVVSGADTSYADGTYAFTDTNLFISAVKNASGTAKTEADLFSGVDTKGWTFSVTAVTSNGKVVEFKVILK